MNKIYHLSSCDTNRKIIKRLGGLMDFEKQEIKSEPITAVQVDGMKDLAGSYEALFSRRAMKFKTMNLKEKVLKEKDYKSLILKEYTFLKRPVIIANGKIFIGNAEAVIASLEKEIKR
jgi:arsenate reductase